jgi:mono/diheme cytochrome c family protein
MGGPDFMGSAHPILQSFHNARMKIATTLAADGRSIYPYLSCVMLHRIWRNVIRRFVVVKFYSNRPMLAACCLAAMLFLMLPRLGAQNPTGPRPAARPPSTVGSQGPLPEHAKFTSSQIEAGGVLFLQNCAFCHGKDAGAESQVLTLRDPNWSAPTKRARPLAL